MTLLAPSPPSRLTPDDLLELSDDHLYELVDGRLVEKQMSSLASKTATIVIEELSRFVRSSHAGDVYTEQSFRCFPDDPDLIRRPDIAFIAASRLCGVPEEGHIPIAPDLAIEVVSPNDKIYELEEKLANYNEAGVRVTWVVNPKLRTLRIHRLDRTIIELRESDILSGESVLPGFTISVKELLPAKPQAAPQPEKSTSSV